MRRTGLLLLAAALALLGPLAACGDDDASIGEGPTTSDQVSTEGVCELLDVARASAALGVEIDKAIAAEGSCTYTSTSAQTTFIVQVTEEGTEDPGLVLETMGLSCDEGTRQDRTLRGASGGFSCLAGGVPNVVAAGDDAIFVVTGNSRDEGTSPQQVADGLATVLEDAIAAYGSAAGTPST